ncbi:hypothetical protein [Streptomyces zingiberis]|uniref:Uncharacterized protein n=1 Tax=Streptomyces zingiberis TaxID=2053010 RepID=A0ABX1C3G7_9ACTN|nr:hypothetical protein [Streptomyces zingiberis]NJQ02680.1 hypothetical protein [Streptomyces zingiberis]
MAVTDHSSLITVPAATTHGTLQRRGVVPGDDMTPPARPHVGRRSEN